MKLSFQGSALLVLSGLVVSYLMYRFLLEVWCWAYGLIY
jgi:hypothetical protein